MKHLEKNLGAGCNKNVDIFFLTDLLTCSRPRGAFAPKNEPPSLLYISARVKDTYGDREMHLFVLYTKSTLSDVQLLRYWQNDFVYEFHEVCCFLVAKQI